MSRSYGSAPETLNRVIDDFFGGLGRLDGRDQGGLAAGFVPPLDASDNDDEIRISLELPGMDEKDIDITLDTDTLVVRGQKAEQSERDDSGGHWVERRYGSFRRVIPLPCEIAQEDVKATFKKGVLDIALPKTQATRRGERKVAIASDST